MEAAGERKCDQDRDARRKRAKSPEAEDDEVEEFYAILRRVRVAVKYFKRSKEDGNGEVGRKLTATRGSSRPRPSFERKDFEGLNGDVKDQEAVEESAGLDLNADPTN